MPPLDLLCLLTQTERQNELNLLGVVTLPDQVSRITVQSFDQEILKIYHHQACHPRPVYLGCSNILVLYHYYWLHVLHTRK